MMTACKDSPGVTSQIAHAMVHLTAMCDQFTAFKDLGEYLVELGAYYIAQHMVFAILATVLD